VDADTGAVAPPRRAALTTLFLGSALLGLLASGPLYDGDGWWHLRTGELILHSHRLPRSDPFSWTAHGRPWQPNAWLADVFFALIHRGLGNVGLSVFKGVAVVGIAFALYGLGRAAGARPWPSAVAGLGGVAAIFLLIVERPQTLSYLLLAAALALGPRALRGSNRALAALGALIVLWASVHGAFVAGVAVIAAMAVGRALQRRTWARSAMVIAVVGVAGLLNPSGVSDYTNAGRIRAASQGIREWRHLQPWGWPDRPMFIFGVVALVCLLATGRWRRLDVLLPALLLACLAIDALRNQPLFVVGTAGEVALGLARLEAPTFEHRRVFAGLALVGWAIAALALASYAVGAAGKPRRTDFPTRAVEALPAHCRLLNEYTVGGYVIWYRPDVPVSQDGRNDVYGRRLLQEQRDVLAGKPTTDAALTQLDRWGVGCALVRPDRPVAIALGGDPRWRKALTEEAGTLFERR
jgi:hypothetical protein